MSRWTGAAAVLALGAACAGAPPIPSERFSKTEAEIRAAQEIGAEKTAQAKLHLQKAGDELQAAKAMSQSNPDEASRILETSMAEAELANALRREEIARTEADQATSRLDALKKAHPSMGGGQ